MPGLKDTASALQSVPQAGGAGSQLRGGGNYPSFEAPGWQRGQQPPSCDPSEPGEASREELVAVCTAASWIFLFSIFWVSHITF